MKHPITQQVSTSLVDAVPIEQSVYLHTKLMRRFNQKQAVGKVNVLLLLSILHQSCGEFAGKKFFPTLLEQTAYVWREVTLKKPFPDGNKRMSYLIALRWLQLNGYTISVKQPEIIQECMNVEDEDEPVEKLVDWLRKVIKKRT